MANIRKRGTAWQVRGGPAGTTRTFFAQRDARTYLADLESRRRLGHLYRERPERFGEFAQAWLGRQTGIAAKTRKSYGNSLRLLQPLDTLYLNEVTTSTVDDLIAGLARKTPASAGMALGLCKRVLRAARERGQTIDKGVLRIRSPKHTTRPGRFLTWEEIREIASWMPEYLHRAVPLAALTGLRVSELMALEDSHIDLAVQCVYVPGTKTRASKARVPISPAATQLIREQLLVRHADGVHLFCARRTGERLSTTYFLEVFHAAVLKADLDGVKFHHLRHTFGGLLVQQGVHPSHAAGLYRHKGERLFLDLYGKVRPEDLRAAVQGLGSDEGAGELAREVR